MRAPPTTTTRDSFGTAMQFVNQAASTVVVEGAAEEVSDMCYRG